jgi:hypothetical protein
MKPYIIYVGKGNNSTLIKNVVKNRPWWVVTEDRNDPTINMVWTQLRQNEVLSDFKSLKDMEHGDLVYEIDDNAMEENIAQQADESDTEGKLVKNRTFSRSQSVNNRDTPISFSNMIKQKRNNFESKEREVTSSKIIPAKDLK